MVIVDFNQAVIAAIASQSEELKGMESSMMEGLVRHTIFSMLIGWRKKFNEEIIIACDSRDYWRTDILPSYKGHRKHRRDDLGIDFDLVHKVIADTKKDLKEHFPFKVIEVPRVEADDIIAVIAKHLQDNELKAVGMFDEPQPLTIISTDKDFIQLQRYRNVSQWNNVKKEYVTHQNPFMALREKIITGDNGDNIPSIVTPEQWSIDRANNVKTRAPSLKAAKREKLMNEGIAGCETKEEYLNWERNQALIDFDKIPEHIYNAVIEAYKHPAKAKNHLAIMTYMGKHKMKLLINEVQYI